MKPCPQRYGLDKKKPIHFSFSVSFFIQIRTSYICKYQMPYTVKICEIFYLIKKYLPISFKYVRKTRWQ